MLLQMLAGISSSNALLVCNKNVGCGTTQAPDNKSPVMFKVCRCKPFQQTMENDGSKCQWHDHSRYQRGRIPCELSLHNVGQFRSSVVKENGGKLQMKLDTGTLANFIPWRTFKKLGNSPPIQRLHVWSRAYGDHVIDHKDKATLAFKANHCEEVLEFYVAMTNCFPS